MKKLALLAAALLLSSCANQQAVHKEVKKLQTGPSASPHRPITNFSDGLRCMDNKMIEYGVRDVSMLVEDLSDSTGKVNAGTKDMLITAVSAMTRRSRAVKLIPFGNDSGNLISFLGAAGSQSPYNVIPQYDIRGSISQLDSSVVRKQSGASIAASKWGLGASESTAGSILGLDLSVLSTEDLSVLPGVTSSNAVVLFKSGKGADADATIKKTGISFDFQVSKSEATIQALRNLIELASIELIGKLAKIPYWQCLEIPEDSPEIQQEMEDWYYAMRAHGELSPYVRGQLIARGHYPMTLTDQNLALTQAIKNYQQANGMRANGSLDYKLFKAVLTGNAPAEIAAPKQAVATTVTTPVATPAATKTIEQAVSVPALAPAASTTETTVNLSLSTGSASSLFQPGQTISLLASVDSSAYLYCYFTDENNNTQRFFPNRFNNDNFVTAGSAIQLPGNMPFDIVATSSGKAEYITCFASAKNLYHDLPHKLRTYDFEDLDIRSTDEISAGFNKASDGQVTEQQFAIRTR